MAIVDSLKPFLRAHYITNIILASLYFALKTTPGVCSTLFKDCRLELKEWEWLTFLGCIIVLKNRKQANLTSYVGTACMFGKVLNLILFFKYSLAYGILYFFLALLHFVFLPQPVYDGPEDVTYFRGPNLQHLRCFRDIRSCVDGYRFGIDCSTWSKQLPTVILFQEGKEKIRRPTGTKKTTLKFLFTKESVIQALELNELYGQCKKHPIHKNKGNKEKAATAENAAVENAAVENAAEEETKKDK
ncbi:thioredoxin-related transmembrane protein 2-like [Babylonia areolata]|uniref:thioredoxin-related transmembrane protein 2-like n=1 Tax=Babylonia areolata TaxID=304850 RepID=UPI003FD5260C